MNELIRMEDLINNPTPRIPVALCLDTSSSMNGAPINELNAGIREFYKAIKDDEEAFFAAEVAIISFGSGGVSRLQDFCSLAIAPNPPKLISGGMTPMGEGMNLALDLLEKRKSDYKKSGVSYYQPWLVLMTDGEPNGDISQLERAIKRTTESVLEKKLTIFPIGIGSGADMQMLARFSPNKPPLKLHGLKFKEFFVWLSQSVSIVSKSQPGDSIKLPTQGIDAWGSL